MTPPDAEGRSTRRVRTWTGPALLAYGYRPFFLCGALWSALAMSIWIASFAGWIGAPPAFDPISWHAHEMLFGSLGAFLAGFLLTAVPNWTGRFPIVGWPVAGILALWLAGRAAVAAPVGLPPQAVMAVDLLFPLVLVAAMGREIRAGKNWRNLPVLALYAGFIVANALFHLEAMRGDYAAGGTGFRLGLAVAVGFVTLIGGRVVPSFTRNWLVKSRRSPLPRPFGPIDRLALGLTLIALFSWVMRPAHDATAILCLGAGLANLIRLWRWAGLKTGAEPLVWILHAGYAFVPLGFVLVALSHWQAGLMPAIAAQHIWMIGAVGVMPLAVMSRASLAHAGHPMTASRGVRLVYLLVLAAAPLRIAAGYDAAPFWLAHLSAVCWIAGFAGFALLYWPLWTRLRAPRRAG